MFKKSFFIVTSVLIVIGCIFYFGFTFNKATTKSFKASGHIITTTKNNKTAKYYFNNNSSYKDIANNRITFKDTDNTDVKVKDSSFVHYENNSISTLKKGVILDLDNLNTKVFK